MNRGNTQRSPPNRSPYQRKRRSPLNISPLNRGKPSLTSYNQNSQTCQNTNVHLTDTTNHNDNILKNLQQQPLQFSAGRRLKYKASHSNQHSVSPFVNSSAYTYNTNTYQTNKLNNENKNYDYNSNIPKNESYQLQKLKNKYEIEIKTILDNNRSFQVEFQNKIKAIDKEKSYWRQNYCIIKDQFHNYVQNSQQRQRERQKQRQIQKQREKQRDKERIRQRQRQRQRSRDRQRQKSKDKNKQVNQQYGMRQIRNQTITLPSNKPTIDQNIKPLQQQLQKYMNSLKIAQDQIYSLNKFKAQVSYQVNFYKQQNRKINIRVCELNNQIQSYKKQVLQLKQKIKKNQQENVIKSMDIKINNSEPISFSLDSRQRLKEQICNISPEKHQPRCNSNSNSKPRSRSSIQCQGLNLSLNSVSPRHKVPSKHNRSHSGHSHSSHSSHSHSHSHKSRHPLTNQSIQLTPIQINFQQCKQIDRLKYTHRKLQKVIHNQNTQVIRQGLRSLNKKYIQIHQQQQKSSQIFKQCPSTASNDTYRTNDSSIFRYNIGTDSKIIGKPIVIKYL